MRYIIIMVGGIAGITGAAGRGIFPTGGITSWLQNWIKMGQG